MVPVSCTNGTFRWDYPKGHAILHFKDYGKTTSLCFSESLGGDIFTITDKNNHMQLNQLNRGSSAQVCTADSASGQPFVIQVDAPDTMYYMGEFAYEVKIPEDADWTANITVPVSCTNGTFYWNYPRGHAILQFKNYGKTTAICLSDIVGGGMFTITDETHDKQLDQLLRAERVCTDDSEDSFVIQVDAPKFQTYVGGFAY
ncbi:hypothetical protein MAR_000534, partial [Mya arenaria]